MFYLYDVDLTLSQTKKVTILGEYSSLSGAMTDANKRLKFAADLCLALSLQIVQKDEFGVLLVRANLNVDFRPVGISSDQCNLNYFGHYKPF